MLSKQQSAKGLDPSLQTRRFKCAQFNSRGLRSRQSGGLIGASHAIDHGGEFPEEAGSRINCADGTQRNPANETSDTQS